MTGKALNPLCEALKKHQSLEKLDLSYNNLEDLSCIVKLLHSNRSIRVLILAYSAIGEIAADQLGEGLEKNKSVE